MMKVTFVSILVGMSLSVSSQKIERVEPPFWWKGMQNPNLQLMIYGNDIATLTPQITYPGVILEKVIRTGNDNYLFLDLFFDEEVQTGRIPILFTGEKKKELTIEYELKDRASNSSGRQGFDPSDLIYLITPDRFANGDPDNDNVDGYVDKLNREDPYGRHGGDLKGIMDNLGYIKDLGFTAIWLNPVLENNQKKQSYHGYATTDYYKVDPRYGSNEDYRELSRIADSMGIKVIMDMIANHCGSEHWWMSDPPCHDWVNFQDGYKITNHRRTTAVDPYVVPEDRKMMSKGWFVPTMPDLNQENELMATYLIQNSIWWIEYVGLSGIRQDTYSYPNKEFMSDWSCAIMEEYPYFNIVGEEWSANPAIVSYWQAGKNNHDGYTSCLPSLMDFPMNIEVNKGLKDKESWNTGITMIYELITNDFLYAKPENLVIFPDNHDMSRIYTQLDENYDLYKLAITYYLTMRGIPQIYYGTEILMSNPGTDSHGVIRSDYPGGWEGDQVNAFTDMGLSESAKEAKSFFTNLANWRSQSFPVQFGDLYHYIPENSVYVYFRSLSSDGVMVILSKNEDDIMLDLDRFRYSLGKAEEGNEIITGQKILLHKNEQLKVPGMTSMIIEFTKK